MESDNVKPDSSVTRDGCPVEVYALLPDAAVATKLHEFLPPRSSVLDLGAGTGRIANPLSRLGYQVTAVDNSAAMLAHLDAATAVVADIEHLDLGQDYDAVVLASHLVNSPDRATRQALLATVRNHLRSSGHGFIEWHPPLWFDGLEAGKRYSGALGLVETELSVHGTDGCLLDATVTYRFSGRTWAQHFSTLRLTVHDLEAELEAANLTLAGHLPGEESWILVRS